ncbi:MULTISPECIES: hypothetical protein [Spirulina sp. CCY15215]|uniref:dual OB domain-containing protein n=1 Tax=Spirulina sp. CCY15215 TaxID=2767591 RepID=UPI00194F3BD5|nr:hypothetical protein [Spirulina major]
MTTFEIICLANSLKHGGRCIAGFKTDGSGWLRPVSSQTDGTLYQEHYTLSNGQEPELFNILRIECDRPHSRIHQPENWIVSDRPWQFMGWPTTDQLNKLLKPEIQKINYSFSLLGNQGDRLELELLQDNPACASLCLLKPKKLLWKISTFSRRRRYRAIFNCNGTQYNLGITDPHWKNLLDRLDDGEYTCEQAITALALKDFDPTKFLLTISLSEPFQYSQEEPLCCFKLVAAVVNTAYVKSFLNSPEKQVNTNYHSSILNDKIETHSNANLLPVKRCIRKAVQNCWDSYSEERRSLQDLRQTLQNLLKQTLDDFEKDLHCADIAESSYSDRLDKIRKKYPKAYTKWTTEEDEELGILFNNGMSIKDLAKHFQRQPSAMRSRLQKLDLIE